MDQPLEALIVPGVRVVLVDGVGNAVFYDRVKSDGAVIVLRKSRRIFDRVLNEQFEGYDVFRLRDSGQPAIRHVNQYLVLE